MLHLPAIVDLGFPVSLGAGVSAAQEHYRIRLLILSPKLQQSTKLFY
ncbi:MAG: hypothetical protein HOL93_10890 [Candidatus Marinimicrobia bacterium]|nr:hypothetical protein [Candidatus Neomarinimicrobiota bacterium]